MLPGSPRHFGPVVALRRTPRCDEAIALVNDTAYGLNASVWSQDLKRAAGIAAKLHAGTVNINEMYSAAWGSIDAPMGGWGDSGLGRRHGAEGLLQTTWSQTLPGNGSGRCRNTGRSPDPATAP